MPLRVSLVNLQKFTSTGDWTGPASGCSPGTERLVLAAGEDDRPHLRVGEAQPLHRVVQLDVDAEVVGVQLELVARDDAALLIHIEQQPGHVAVKAQPPVPVAVRRGVEGDLDRSGLRLLRWRWLWHGQFWRCARSRHRHALPPPKPAVEATMLDIHMYVRQESVELGTSDY